MALTGNLLTAEQMHQYNMVCKVVPEDRLAEEANTSVARDIAKAIDPLDCAVCEKVLLKIYDPNELGENVDYSSGLNREHKKTEDFKEGLCFQRKKGGRYFGVDNSGFQKKGTFFMNQYEREEYELKKVELTQIYDMIRPVILSHFI